MALTACGVNTEQTESMDNLQTEEQISGSVNVDSSTQTVEEQVTEELDDIVEEAEM